MQKKTGEIFEFDSYKLELFCEETRTQYASLPGEMSGDVGSRMFRYHLPRASREAMELLQKMGIDPSKLHLARPLSEPDEKGEVLFLCAARLCGRLLAGGREIPRRSVEAAGMSLVFVDDRRQFREGLMPFPDPELELRFVIPLPFDTKFFDLF